MNEQEKERLRLFVIDTLREDSYAGFCYVELPNKKFLKWHYEC